LGTPDRRVVRIFLVPAGRTAWDEAGRLAGAADLPMTDAERARLAGAFADLPARPGCVVHAPDEASAATAALLAKAAGCKARAADGLRDPGMGLWEGAVSADLAERCKTAWRQWQSDPTSVDAPEGEPIAAAESRVLTEVRKIVEKAKGAEPVVAVVVRPIALGLLRARLLGEAASALWSVVASAPPAGEVLTLDDPARLSPSLETSRLAS
jgi:broad specificity phosphatase PhoE